MKFLPTLLLILLFTNCTKEKTEEKNELMPLQKVESVTTATVNSTINFSVYWYFTNGCQNLRNFEVVANGNNFIINPYAVVVPATSICTQEAGVKTTIYTYTPTATGTYTFQFKSKDGQVFTRTIIVN